MSSNNDQPLLQKILENNWLLLAIGLLFPLVFYSVWGAIEVLTLPGIEKAGAFFSQYGGK